MEMQSGKQDVLFDATHARETLPKARPMEEQGERESQKLWAPTVQAIKRVDHKAATDEKSKIEDQQREEAAQRGGDDNWQPRLFRKVHGEAGGPEDGEENLDWIISAQM